MAVAGNREHYRPLAIEDDDISLSDKVITPTKSTTPYQYIILWFCIACTVINAVTLFINSRWIHFGVVPPVDRKNIHTLRRPSQYIGFDSIARPSPPMPRNFTNYPLTLAQIDGAEPHKVFESDLRKFMSRSGTVYPDDKKVLVAKKISTIVQFRAIDYGMEDCEIHINLPPSSPSTEYIEALSVYRLQSAVPLDLQMLSFSSAPRRVGKLDDIHAVIGKETRWHRKLSCALEEVLTFELACPLDIPFGKTCHLDWWQRKEESTPAVYIVQRATV